MKPNRIIYIFCSLDDSVHIKNTVPINQGGFIISLYIAQKETSIKQIRKNQLKSRYMQGDFLVLIDNPPKLLFNDDYTSSCIFHFASIDAFFDWISSLERSD